MAEGLDLDHLEALAMDAQRRAANIDGEFGPCSLTCAHNSAYVVAIANSGPALISRLRTLEADPRPAEPAPDLLRAVAEARSAALIEAATWDPDCEWSGAEINARLRAMAAKEAT